MSDLIEKPKPQPNPLSQAYWDGAARGELVLQQCSACGAIRHYPRILCTQCYSDQVQPYVASKRGTIHSWTVSHHAFHPAFRDELPYTTVTVDLEEGVRALGRWPVAVKLFIGMPVVASFEPGGSGPELTFRPV